MRDANATQIVAGASWNTIWDRFVHSEMLKRCPEKVKAASSRKSREVRKPYDCIQLGTSSIGGAEACFGGLIAHMRGRLVV